MFCCSDHSQEKINIYVIFVLPVRFYSFGRAAWCISAGKLFCSFSLGCSCTSSCTLSGTPSSGSGGTSCPAPSCKFCSEPWCTSWCSWSCTLGSSHTCSSRSSYTLFLALRCISLCTQGCTCCGKSSEITKHLGAVWKV